MAIYNSDGTPHYIRCYDDGGKSIDRYTVCFTGRYRHLTGGVFVYLTMNCAPFHPQGFGQHGSSRTQTDRPSGAHLGKRISFSDLPADCQRLVRSDYRDMWGAPKNA